MTLVVLVAGNSARMNESLVWAQVEADQIADDEARGRLAPSLETSENQAMASLLKPGLERTGLVVCLAQFR